MGYVEARRRQECIESDCPVMRYCKVYWGKECIRQFGNRIPRFKGFGNPFRRAAQEIERKYEVERVSTLGTVIWLNRNEEEPINHPMQDAFSGVAGR